MTDTVCPVDLVLRKLKNVLFSNEIRVPYARVMTDAVLKLVKDISEGRGDMNHLSRIISFSQQLSKMDCDPKIQSVGLSLSEMIEKEYETFLSHIETKNCITQTCKKLIAAPCQMRCPAGIDIPTYLSLIAMKQYEKAIDVIRKDCPFPWVCGLVCTRPCEGACVRKKIDTPISIKFLKGFAAKMAKENGRLHTPEKNSSNGKKVCVLGAGPSGMTVAYYLALKGYAITIFEKAPKAGGMLLLGIPRYRLPGKVIDDEVSILRALGVTFCFNTVFGKDETFNSLKAKGFDVFFIGIGAHQTLRLNIEGEADFPQVLDAIAFLRDVALDNRPVIGKKVVVVGGGNVAIDAARTALRLGASQVRIVYRRDRNEMPADSEEIRHAEEEGILFSFLTVPIAVKGKNGILTGIKCLKARLEKRGKTGRAYPYPIEGSGFTITADSLILAIGQKVDGAIMEEFTQLNWSRRGTIETDGITKETSVPGIFAGGDAVTGPATVIEAIQSGKMAAEAIHRHFLKIPHPTCPPIPYRRGKMECLKISSRIKASLQRPEMPLLDMIQRKTTFKQVEKGYTESIATEEASRCLRCDICIRCGKCVDICQKQVGIHALLLGYFNTHPSHTDFTLTEKKCILCGACAINCPTGAMKIEDISGERVLSLCGMVLNKAPLIKCRICNDDIAPLRYLEFINIRTKEIPSVMSVSFSCDKCARQSMSVFLMSVPH